MAIRISDHFTTGRLIRFALPSAAMMVFISVYGVVDGFFVSNYAGKTAFAAVNLIMPYLMLMGGAGFMIGTGGSALVAMVLGQKDEARAQRNFAMCIEFAILLGAVLTVLGIAALPAVARALGADETLLPLCVAYGRIDLSFGIAFVLQSVFQSFLVTAERPRLGFAVTLAAGFANMILDWVFVAKFGWGIEGAALATGVSECVGGFVPLVYFLCPNKSLLRLRPAVIKLRVLVRVCTNGISELLNNISSSLVSMVFNWQLLRYAGEDGVAAYGVLMYVCFIFIAMFVGYAVGTAPIVSFHYGAGNRPEMRSLLRKSMTVMAVSGVVMVLAGQLLANPLAALFVGYDEALCRMTERAFHIFALSFLLTGMNIYASSFFTALNNGLVSAVISILRTLVFELLAVMVLPMIFGIGGIWSALTVAEALAFAVSMAFLAGLRKKYGY